MMALKSIPVINIHGLKRGRRNNYGKYPNEQAHHKENDRNHKRNLGSGPRFDVVASSNFH